MPKLPEDLGSGVLRIQGVVDLDGYFREPAVLGEGSPDTIYRVLEALREWRYAPARRNLRRVASFRSVYVGALGGDPAARLQLGQPIPNPGNESGVFNGARANPAPIQPRATNSSEIKPPS
jgi:hypothetical protein